MSIKTDAIVIRDETIAGANTATRVGTNLSDIADDLVAKQAAIDLNTAKETNIAHPLVETAVPVGAVFTDNDTIYDDTAIQAEVDLNTAKVGITTQQAADILTNNAKVGVTIEEANPDVVSQVEAEAGVATTERIWTAERVKQAIDALSGGGPGGGGGAFVDDTAYDISWDGVIGVAPSKNALYDFIESQVFKVDATSNIIPIFWGGTQAEYDIDFPAGHDPEYFIVITDGALTPTSASDIVNVPSGNLVATDVQGALDELQTEVDGLVTNATHTGEVTGSSALTLDATAISNKTLDIALVGTEEVLMNDAGTLKKTTTQAIADLGGGGGSLTMDVLANQDATELLQYNKEYMLPGYASATYDAGNFSRMRGNIFHVNNNAVFGYPLSILFNSTTTAGVLAFQRGAPITMYSNIEFHHIRNFFIDAMPTDGRFFIGVSATYGAVNPTNVEPDTQINSIGICKLSTSNNLHIMHNNATGTATTFDLGVNYPANDTSLYYYKLEVSGNLSGTVNVKVTRITRIDGTEITTSQVITTNINAINHLPVLWVTNNATASAASIKDRGVINYTKTN